MSSASSCAVPETSLKAPRTLVTIAWREEKPTRLWVGSMLQVPVSSL